MGGQSLFPSLRPWDVWPANNDTRIYLLLGAVAGVWALFFHTEGMLATVSLPSLWSIAMLWSPISLSAALLASWLWLPRPLRRPVVIALEFTLLGLLAVEIWRGRVVY